ncbi:MAG: sigma-54-dependent Fis family transcriptional regulator [Termitinemataceae bacterium]|nr:MAG: sigma-54-dependent Fis family transcriptional regulator [Termitinemataceae bacterium]
MKDEKDAVIAELEILFEIVRTLDKHVDLRASLGPVLSILEIRAQLKRGMITLLDRSSGLLKIEEAYGLSKEEKTRGVYRLGEGLVGRVFESGSAICVADLSKEQRFLNRAKNRTREDMQGMSYICTPIRASTGIIGTLSAERSIGKGKSSKIIEKIMSRDCILLEKVAVVIADSHKLRERILEEQFKFFKDSNFLSAGTTKSSFYAKNQDNEGTYNEGTYLDSGCKIIGKSGTMKEVFSLISHVAPSEANVLIAGESGTGKELVAAEICRLSKRAALPFVKVNCAALPQSIIESELFGHEKGSFTGALAMRKGRFEMADTGTLFLDEIGELPLQIQVKLLRVLQEKEIERVGGTETLKVNVRIIAASNRNLEEEVKQGRFREDLFYRLNVFMLLIPPLRERKSDIMLLADHFTEKYAKKNEKLIKRISSPAIDLLTGYHWPGNVRELENCIERAVILSEDMVIHSYNLPPSLQSADSSNTTFNTTLESAISRLEKEMITETLKKVKGNMSAAARVLGISERQIGLRIHHYGIKWKQFRPV